MGRLNFARGSLGPLSEQLGEVKAISEVLYSARVNAMDGIQRIKVSTDDENGPQSDYLNEMAVTNEFGGSDALSGHVPRFQPGNGAGAGGVCDFAKRVYRQNNQRAAGVRRRQRIRRALAGTPPPPVTGRGGLQTILNEQLLRVTMEVVAVRIR